MHARILSVSTPPPANALKLLTVQSYAISLGGPCLLRGGHVEVNGEMVWMTAHERYLRVLSGEEAWLKRGYRVELWLNGTRAATVIPPRRGPAARTG
jgi:hypothetical protein